jgi:hypothetical protein
MLSETALWGFPLLRPPFLAGTAPAAAHMLSHIAHQDLPLLRPPFLVRTAPAAAHMLSSIATLMHDTYLPVYLTEVLRLSNTEVRHSLLLCCHGAALASHLRLLPAGGARDRKRSMRWGMLNAAWMWLKEEHRDALEYHSELVH